VNVCYVYPYELADGPANMALDEALLEAVGSGEVPAALRVYGWSVPTLSLGYFQRFAEVLADERFSDVPVVRRPTGGGAIWHHHDLTYAVALPESHALSRPSTQLYRAVHAAISGGLERIGIRSVRQGELFPRVHCERSRHLLCFTDLSPEDVVVAGSKVVGSAQRRRGGAILQHGSILLASSARTPELAGLSDLADVAIGLEEWCGALAEWIAQVLCVRAEAARIPESVLARAGERETGRYRNAAWTKIR
jgi:lipoate-protein ligase A